MLPVRQKRLLQADVFQPCQHVVDQAQGIRIPDILVPATHPEGKSVAHAQHCGWTRRGLQNAAQQAQQTHSWLHMALPASPSNSNAPSSTVCPRSTRPVAAAWEPSSRIRATRCACSSTARRPARARGVRAAARPVSISPSPFDRPVAWSSRGVGASRRTRPLGGRALAAACDASRGVSGRCHIAGGADSADPVPSIAAVSAAAECAATFRRLCARKRGYGMQSRMAVISNSFHAGVWAHERTWTAALTASSASRSSRVPGASVPPDGGRAGPPKGAWVSLHRWRLERRCRTIWRRAWRACKQRSRCVATRRAAGHHAGCAMMQKQL